MSNLNIIRVLDYDPSSEKISVEVRPSSVFPVVFLSFCRGKLDCSCTSFSVRSCFFVIRECIKFLRFVFHFYHYAS